MSSRGRSVVTTGLTIVLLAASQGVSSGGGYGLLLCLLGLLAGVDLMAVGIWMADNTSATAVPAIGVLACFLRRNLTLIGLITASSAVTAVAGETSPALCIGFFVLLLLGLSMTISGVLGLPPLAGNGEEVVQEA
jgi:hypothetical protein